MLEDRNTIDMALVAADGAVELVISDGGVTTDDQPRLELVRKKLGVYAAYIRSDEFVADHPGKSREDTRIRVMCAHPPTAQMQAITHFPEDEQAPLRTPVRFEHFPM